MNKKIMMIGTIIMAANIHGIGSADFEEFALINPVQSIFSLSQAEQAAAASEAQCLQYITAGNDKENKNLQVSAFYNAVSEYRQALNRYKVDTERRKNDCEAAHFLKMAGSAFVGSVVTSAYCALYCKYYACK